MYLGERDIKRNFQVLCLPYVTLYPKAQIAL